jgi:two-component system, response regulator FlrC
MVKHWPWSFGTTLAWICCKAVKHSCCVQVSLCPWSAASIAVNLELAVQAMRQGAAHVLATDDWSAGSWQIAHQAIQALRLSSSAASMVARMAPPSEVAAAATPQKSVVYVDPVSRHLLALAQRVAQANVTALIEGPTGAGKEILARVLHESSKRARGPLWV